MTRYCGGTAAKRPTSPCSPVRVWKQCCVARSHARRYPSLPPLTSTFWPSRNTCRAGHNAGVDACILASALGCALRLRLPHSPWCWAASVVNAHHVGHFGGVTAQPEQAGLAHDVPQDDVCVLSAAGQHGPAGVVPHRRHRTLVSHQCHLRMHACSHEALFCSQHALHQQSHIHHAQHRSACMAQMKDNTPHSPQCPGSRCEWYHLHGLQRYAASPVPPAAASPPLAPCPALMAVPPRCAPVGRI